MKTIEGLPLRDWPAGQALPVVLKAYELGNRPCIGTDHMLRNVPIICYRLADAMLAASKATP